MASSTSKKNSSPLAAFAPLHALAQLVPAPSPDASSASKSKPASKSKREREGAYILLTDLETDAWRVHVGHPDGRWWSGAWRAAEVEKLAVRSVATVTVIAEYLLCDLSVRS
jgi:hypothetical protein